MSQIALRPHLSLRAEPIGGGNLDIQPLVTRKLDSKSSGIMVTGNLTEVPSNSNSPDKLNEVIPEVLNKTANKAIEGQYRILDDEACQIARAERQPGPNGDVFIIPRSCYSPVDGEETIIVPEYLNSVATLEFCGFDPNIAQSIYRDYNSPVNAVDEHLQDIIEFAQKHVHSKAQEHDAWGVDDDWDKVLSEFGISDSLKANILDKDYIDIRLTGTASWWVIDTLQIGRDFLRDLRPRIMELSGSSGGKASAAPKIEKDAAIAQLGEHFKRLIGLTGASGSAGFFGNTGSDAITLAAIEQYYDGNSKIPKTLYKGGTTSRLRQMFKRDNENIIVLNPLLSSPPTDFHHTSFRTLYFTQQAEGAKKYAEWASKRKKEETGAVLLVVIPPKLLKDMLPISDEQVKDLVWYCRRDYPLNNAARSPQDVRHLQKRKVLQGKICLQSNATVKTLHTKRDMKFFTIKGVPVTQTVFLNTSFFEREGEKFVWMLSEMARKAKKVTSVEPKKSRRSKRLAKSAVALEDEEIASSESKGYEKNEDSRESNQGVNSGTQIETQAPASPTLFMRFVAGRKAEVDEDELRRKMDMAIRGSTDDSDGDQDGDGDGDQDGDEDENENERELNDDNGDCFERKDDHTTFKTPVNNRRTRGGH